MVKEDLKVIAQYYELYAFLWQEPRTKEQIAKYVVDDLKMAKSTGSVYSNDVFAGNLPLVVVADDKAFVDQMQYREFMEKFSTEIGGKDAYKLFCEPPPAPKGKNTESEIGKITTTESPIVQELNKKLGSEKAKVSKGDLVTTLTTGKDGKATAKNLPLGQYRVVEVEAPYGYVLNPNEQKVTFTYVDDKTPVIKESLTFSDDRQKLDMSVTKLDAEDNTPIAGAVFGLYADEDIKNVDGKVIIEKGTLLEKTTSDENGKIAFIKV